MCWKVDITLSQRSIQSRLWSSSGQVQLWELYSKEGRAPRNWWCLWIAMLEKIPESPLNSKEIKIVNLKENQTWIFTGSWSSSILVTWCKQLTHWKSPQCWERWRAEGEEGFREWNGWMASLMQWTRSWANFRRQWGTKRPGICSPWGHRVGHDWATEQQVSQEVPYVCSSSKFFPALYCTLCARWAPY